MKENLFNHSNMTGKFCC